MSSIFEEITILGKNFEKRMCSPRHVMYISIENVYFPINLKGMTAIKSAAKTADLKNKCQMSR